MNWNLTVNSFQACNSRDCLMHQCPGQKGCRRRWISGRRAANFLAMLLFGNTGQFNCPAGDRRTISRSPDDGTVKMAESFGFGADVALLLPWPYSNNISWHRLGLCAARLNFRQPLHDIFKLKYEWYLIFILVFPSLRSLKESLSGVC